MLQREDEGDWGPYCCFQLFERVSYVTFQKNNMTQWVETSGSYLLIQSKEEFSKKIAQRWNELVLESMFNYYEAIDECTKKSN